MSISATSPRRALVTGASSGIGKAFAQSLAKEGYQVVALGRQQSALDAMLRSLPGASHQAMAADLSAPSDIQRVADSFATQRVHLLINNAGSGLYGDYADKPWSELHALFQLNCMALAQLSHAYLAHAQSGDALVNVSSVLAFLPQPTVAAYAASKAFVTSLSEALWFENRPRGVYVMALHPGMTRTEFRQRAGGGARYGRTAQDPEDVVQVALHHLRKRREGSVQCGPLNALISAVPRLLKRQHLVQLLGTTRRAQDHR